jgi:hypothetical protein
VGPQGHLPGRHGATESSRKRSRPCTGGYDSSGLQGACGARRGLEAIGAVDGTVHPRNERDLSLLAAARARRRVHLTLRARMPVAVTGSTLFATRWAALRVLELAGGIKLLLGPGEQKRIAAVDTGQIGIFVDHFSHLWCFAADSGRTGGTYREPGEESRYWRSALAFWRLRDKYTETHVNIR